MSDRGLQSDPKIREFLMGIEIYDVLDNIVDQYKLPAERVDEFLDLTDAVMNQQLAVEKMPEFLKEAFGLSPEDAKTVSIQLVGHRLLPLEHYLPGMEKQLVAWGGRVQDFPDLRIEEDPVTVASLLREQANKLGLELPEHLMKRFVYLSKGYVSKERSKDATQTLLKRPLNIGGLGMTDDHIEKLFGWLDELDLSTAEDYNEHELGQHEAEELETVSSNDDKEGGEPEVSSSPEPEPEPEQSAPVPAIATTQAITDEVPVIAGELIADHEKQEVEEHKRALENMPAAPVADELSKHIDQAVQSLIEHAPGQKLSKKKASSLAEAFIKGRLDAGRLYQQLKEVHQFETADAQAVLLPLAKVKKEWEASHRVDEKPQIVKEPVAKTEQSLMDRRHAALTKEPVKQSVEPVLPGARVSAARTKDEELRVQHESVDVEAEQVAKQKDRPAKAKVKLSTPSAPPKPAEKEKQTVTDVKFTPTLVGPVEELGTMSVGDFRRLSSEPAEAVCKILDILTLLEDDAYEKRIEGIKAWRTSPMNQLYLQMMQQGLHEGVSISEIASKRRNAGEESLSPPELQAIVSLNSQISF